MTAPTPVGLLGCYDGTCIVCLRPTDTALAFRGPAEWHLSALKVLGVPEDQAYATKLPGWRERYGTRPGEVPDGVLSEAYRVCLDSVRACPAPFPDPVLVDGAELPTIEHLP
jgi:hypothetical protein